MHSAKLPPGSRSKNLLRVALYVLLIITAAFALLARPYLLAEIRAEHFLPVWILVGPVLFGSIFLIFCIDEIFIRGPKKGRRKTSIVPMAFGALLLVLVLPSSFQEYKTRQIREVATPAFYKELLKSKDARVRALVMIASSCSVQSGNEWSEIMHKGLNDTDPLVQGAAIQEVASQLGVQLPSNDEGAKQALSLLATWNESYFAVKKSVK